MIISRRPLLMGAAAAGFAATNAFAQSAADFMGEWNGVLNLGSQHLRLRLVVAEGPTSTLFSVDQGNNEIPVAATRIEGDQLALDIPVVRASFRGRLTSGRIEGTFTQGGSLPLVFQRGEANAAATEVLTQARLAALRARAGSPGMGAAALNRDGRNVAFADGLRAIGQPQAITTSDKWHLGSICKSMTSTLVARAVEAGAVSWNDTVGGVLGSAIPDMRAEYRDITFRHLLSHRSGMQGNIDMADLLAFPRESADSRADRVRYARIGLLQSPVGPREQTFTYSNTGYIVAGAMLEAKMGAPWETLIQQHLFAPLGMTSAGQGAPGTPGAYDQPVGHTPGPTTSNGGVVTIPMIPHPVGGSAVTDNPAALGPAGRVHATFEDVFKYLAAHRDRTSFLSEASWQMLQTAPFGGPYAMGWQVDGGRLWHNGSNTMWYAEVMVDRTRGIVAAATVNDGRAGDVRPVVGDALVSAAQAVA